MTEQIPVNKLFAHPKNPRLEPRQDVVDQIAAQLVDDGFDEAHALIVRPNGKGYEIVSGHHRWLAAKQVKLKAVPCWVREMTDDEAYMALVFNNAQGELAELEIGLHANRIVGPGNPKTVEEYAKEVGVGERNLENYVCAARVFAHVCENWAGTFHGTPEEQQDALDRLWDEGKSKYRHFAEVHAAAKWLWSALVGVLIKDNWTVEQTRKKVNGLKDVLEPPEWTDSDALADELVAGEIEPEDIERLIEPVQAVEAKIEQCRSAKPADERIVVEDDLVEADRLAGLLLERLMEKRPSTPAEVRAVCAEIDTLVSKLLDLQRERWDEIKGKRLRWQKNISLEEWNSDKCTDDDHDYLLNLDVDKVVPGQFIEQVDKRGDDKRYRQTGLIQPDGNIEWAMYSWNPVTGCLHNCPYCYARDIALGEKMEKAYPHGFEPALRPEKLLTPRVMKVPKEAKTDIRHRNVFTCSMADLFGRWVPAEWIEAVLDEVRNAPDWNFLFLTKFPKRMAEFDIPKNTWMGTTIDLQARVANAEKAFAKVKADVRWVSIEPMLEPIKFKNIKLFDWIVLGGSTPSSKTPQTDPPTPETPAWRPPASWIIDLTEEARAAGVKVYWKSNLLGKRILEMPHGAPIVDDEGFKLPDVFKYLGKANDGVEK